VHDFGGRVCFDASETLGITIEESQGGGKRAGKEREERKQLSQKDGRNLEDLKRPVTRSNAASEKVGKSEGGGKQARLQNDRTQCVP